MNPKNDLRFAFSDRINDAEVGPHRVPLNLLGDFQRDVGDFLKGSSKDVDPSEVMISVEEGSLAFVATGLLAASTLWTDLEHLKSPDSLSDIDSKRAAVVERWQSAARQHPNRVYRIVNVSAQISLTVDSSSDFRKIEEAWVPVEKYVHGRIVDWGGKTKANVHIDLDGGGSLIIAASQDLLAQEEQNRLYRPALLLITAEENLTSGELRNPRLLSFESHDSTFDDTEFAEMVRRGSAAWADVPDATNWLEELRGEKK